jgi:iron complex transport system ATP-binding protein
VRAVLALEHVSFGYHSGRCVLQDVSLQVAPGEVLALVGPNGVGKSTLLRLMAGLRRPWEGQLLLAGRDMALMSRREVARTVAVVPQEVHMPFPFTVRQVVELGRTPYVKPFALGGDHRDRTAVERALALLGLEGMAHRPFVELSGGERRRVIIAMALAQEPQLLLLDEPTAHLDIGHQVEVMGLLSRLAHEGLAVVAALHDLNLALRFAHRVALLHRGRLLAQGPPEEVLRPHLVSEVYGIPLRLLRQDGQQVMVWDAPYGVPRQ